MWCVSHNDGRCLMAEQPTGDPQYRDSEGTLCGYFVTLPTGYSDRLPTCTDCRRLSLYAELRKNPTRVAGLAAKLQEAAVAAHSTEHSPRTTLEQLAPTGESWALAENRLIGYLAPDLIVEGCEVLPEEMFAICDELDDLSIAWGSYLIAGYRMTYYGAAWEEEAARRQRVAELFLQLSQLLMEALED